MRKFIVPLWFLNIFWFEFVFADPDDNTSEGNGVNNKYLKFYVGPNMRKAKNTNCLGQSCTSKTTKCSYEDIDTYQATEPSFISTGKDGKVSKFKRLDGKVMAVKKRFKRDEKANKIYKREVDLLERIKGTGITADIDCKYTDKDGYNYYMMEYLNGKKLTDASFYNPQKDNFEHKWADLCLNMAVIVERMNNLDVFHLNISDLENWMVAPDGRLYIIDVSSGHTSWLLMPKLSKEADAFDLGFACKNILINMGVSLVYYYRSEGKKVDDITKEFDEVDMLEIIFGLFLQERTVTASIKILEKFRNSYDPSVKIGKLARKKVET